MPHPGRMRTYGWLLGAVLWLAWGARAAEAAAPDEGVRLYLPAVLHIQGPVLISEIMALNDSGLADEDGDRSDWIELYNAGRSGVNVGGWSLTDDPERPDKWTLPPLWLESGAYMVVFASGKNRHRPQLHTNFKLDGEGDYLALYAAPVPLARADAVAPAYPRQRSDVSYGRSGPNGVWHYLGQPTPGGPNAASPAWVGMVDDVQFSRERGFYDQPLLVELHTATAGAQIRYTIDGSWPRADHGAVYAAPIAVTRTTTLRAAAFKPQYLPAYAQTHTYIYLDDVLRQPAQPPGFPPTWGYYPEGPLRGQPVPADYEVDPDVVSDPRYAASIRDDLKAIPSLSLVAEVGDLFDPQRGIYSNPLHSGWEWERPASVELLAPDSARFGVNCGLRIAGGWSRKPDSMAKHSFSLRFRGRYGASRLNYPLIPHAPVASFESLRLRGGQADTFLYVPGKAQYLHDEWGREVQREIGPLAAQGTFAHLYLNGLYWGLYNMVEEPDAAFAAGHLGGTKSDYDVIQATPFGGDPVEDGSLVAFERLMAIDNLADPAQFERVSELLDIRQFIDYMIIQMFGANKDWPHNNWFAIRRRTPGEKFRFLVWDIEQMAQLLTYDANASTVDTPGPAGLHARLMASPEYRLMFADRVHQHLSAGGALSPERNVERYERLAWQIERAIVGESARWGDVEPPWRTLAEQGEHWEAYWTRKGRGGAQTRDDDWLPERRRIVSEFFPLRSAVFVGQLRNAGLLPDVNPPNIRATGGFASLSAESGNIFYTTDGTDPRQAFTDQPSPRAKRYAWPLAIDRRLNIRARARSGSAWSALAEANVGRPRLRISELMYHPADDESREFIEIRNLEPLSVDLAGMYTRGVTFTFPSGSVIKPDGLVVLAASDGAFRQRYPGVALAGSYSGRLSNGGEEIGLFDSDGTRLDRVVYDDSGLWPLAPDGLGFSMVRVGLDADADDPENWRASARPGGSPGLADPLPQHGRVVINEVLAEASPPWTPAVELYALEGPPPSGGWYLSDDLDDLQKLRLAADWPAMGRTFLALYDLQLANVNLLDPRGGTLYLSGWDREGNLTGHLAGFEYGPSEPNVSVGRYRTSQRTNLTALARPTFGIDDPDSEDEFRTGAGAPNAAPRVGPIVINEIMYNPPAGKDEYVELHNLTNSEVTLGGRDAWAFTDGIDLILPEGARIPGRGYVLVVGTDPAEFRARQTVPVTAQVVGPYAGALSNDGELLVLSKPVRHGGELDYVTVDAVEYGDRVPWPALADGRGASLERMTAGDYGNDPANWSAVSASGTPGRANSRVWRLHLPHAGRQ